MPEFTVYRAHLIGEAPGLLMHSTQGMAGLGGNVGLKSELRELTKITASKRTDAQNHRIAEIEAELAIYWSGGQPRLPASVFRAAIEAAARMTKDGPRVRRGLQVIGTTFASSIVNGHDRAAIIEAAIRQDVVRVGQQRVVRTRAWFEDWAATVDIRANDAVSLADLQAWLERAGSMVGVGDWRPDKSGEFGRFAIDSIEVL